MRSLRRLYEIGWGERWLLLKAWLLLGVIRPALRLLPFRVTDELCNRLGESSAGDPPDSFSPHEIAWAVRVAGRFVPAGTHCLTQSQVTRVLLRRRGFPCVVRYGVLKDGGGDLAAHSWVECSGEVVIGGGDLDRYVELRSPANGATSEASQQTEMRIRH